MDVAGIITFVLVYLGGIALRKWPAWKNDYIPRATWVVAIMANVLQQLAGMTVEAPVVGTSFAVLTSMGANAQAAMPVAQDIGAMVAGTKTFLALQFFHLVVEKALIKGLLKVKLPW